MEILAIFSLFMIIPVALHVILVLVNYALVTYVGVPPWLVWNHPDYYWNPVHMHIDGAYPPYGFYGRRPTNESAVSQL